MKYLILGALFGLCFPVVATILDLYAHGFDLSYYNIILIQGSDTLHWIIDTAPIFLGFFAYFIGKRQDLISNMNYILEQKVAERTEQLKNTNHELTRQINAFKRAKRIFGESTKQLNSKINLILSLEKDKEITLLDLFYLEKLQKFQDSFARAFNLSSIITDPDGNPITEPSNYNNICGTFQHNGYGEKHCFQLYKNIGQTSSNSNQPENRKCGNCGLIHAGTPIIIEGKHIGTWIIGHCRLDNTEIEFGDELTAKSGIDNDRIKKEFSNIPIMTESQFNHILNLLMIFTEEISSLGYGNLQLARDIVRRKKVQNEYVEANRQPLLKNEEIANRENRIRSQHKAIVEIASNENIISGNITEALRIITETASKTLAVSRVSIWFFADDGERLEMIDLYESKTETHSHDMSISASEYPNYFKALESDRAVDVSEAQSDPRTSEFVQSYLVRLNIISMLDSAFRVGGKVKGVICCETVETKRVWTSDDISFAGEIADQVAHLLETAERKKAQEQLAIFRRFADDSTLGCAMVNLDGALVYANAAIRAIFGLNGHENVLNRQAIDYYPINMRSKLKSKVLYSILKTGQWIGEITLLHENGSRVITMQNAFLIRDKYGHPQYIANIVSDITDRIEAEEQQKELKDKLEKAEKMESLGMLAGGVAHDLNNMLGPLVGYPEMILRMIDGDSPIKKKVERMGKAARDAAEVISDLLSLARRGRYEMHPLNLIEVVKDYLDSPNFIKLTELRPDVKLNLKCNSTVGNIQGSSPHLAKVVMNLVVNAYDAMPDGGELTVEVSQIQIDKLIGGYVDITEGDYIILRVRDTGQGIELENLNKIFEPYYSNKKMGSSGSGLGLSVVYGIIKDHKGYYDVFSKIGKGTEFVIYFPMISQSVMRKAAEGIELGGVESILIVDDTLEQREVATELLTSLGYKISTAINGRNAIEIVKNKNFDIILLDMIMEKDFDGLDTFRELIKIRPDQKVLIVSGYSSTERVQEMQKLGAGQYIKKPYSLSTISKAVREELDRIPVAVQK